MRRGDKINTLGEVNGEYATGQNGQFRQDKFYQTANEKERPQVPDIAVIKGKAFQHVRHWRVGKHGPAPQVVFEIASEETWQKDVEEKPLKYALMGVQEYIYYDPNVPPLKRR